MDHSALLNETEENPFRKSTLNEKKSETSQSQSVKKSRPCKILALGLYTFTEQYFHFGVKTPVKNGPICITVKAQTAIQVL